MNHLFPLGEHLDTVSPKYADAPSDMPLDSGHQVFLGNSITWKQILWVALLCGLVISIFLFRIVQFQIIAGAEYRNLAEGNRLHVIPIQSKRGLITDLSGNILAENVPSFFASIIPEFLPKDQSAYDDMIASIADGIGVNPVEIEDELSLAGKDLSEPV